MNPPDSERYRGYFYSFQEALLFRGKMYESPLTAFFSNVLHGILSKFPICCVLRYSIENLREDGPEICKKRWVRDTGFPFSIYNVFDQTEPLLPCGLFHHFQLSEPKDVILEILPYLYGSWKPPKEKMQRAIIEQILIHDQADSTWLIEKMERKLGRGIDFSTLSKADTDFIEDLIIYYYGTRRGLIEKCDEQGGIWQFRKSALATDQKEFMRIIESDIIASYYSVEEDSADNSYYI